MITAAMAATPPPRRQLHSIEEITYDFGPTRRTVQHWERVHGLPVRRLPVGKSRVTARTEELNRPGRDARRLAHRQLAGKAPVGNIREALQPLLPEVAARARVSRVMLDPPPGAETVDVTPHLLDALHAGPSTRQIAGNLRQRDQRRGSAG